VITNERQAAGIELVLKDRLRREDWKLIFADITEADEKKAEVTQFQEREPIGLPETARTIVPSMRPKRNCLRLSKSNRTFCDES
jgi:hypothetical protein